MIYLIIAIICGASLAVCFKLFRKLGIDSMQGAFINYITAIAVSLLMSGSGAESLAESIKSSLNASWTWLAVIEGLLFMGGILVLAASTQRSGVALTNVSARASMVMPIVASYLVYRDSSPNWFAIAMIVIAMYLIFGNPGQKTQKRNFKDSLLPLSVFFVYGICDFLLKVLKKEIGVSGNQGNVMLFIFSAAALFCMAAYLIRGNFKEHPFSWKAIPGGIILGLFNSGCTAFMLKALGEMDSALFFSLYNVGIVFSSLLVGTLFFKEKIRPVQYAGVFVASLAIVILFVK